MYLETNSINSSFLKWALKLQGSSVNIRSLQRNNSPENYLAVYPMGKGSLFGPGPGEKRDILQSRNSLTA